MPRCAVKVQIQGCQPEHTCMASTPVAPVANHFRGNTLHNRVSQAKPFTSLLELFLTDSLAKNSACDSHARVLQKGGAQTPSYCHGRHPPCAPEWPCLTSCSSTHPSPDVPAAQSPSLLPCPLQTRPLHPFNRLPDAPLACLLQRCVVVMTEMTGNMVRNGSSYCRSHHFLYQAKICL